MGRGQFMLGSIIMGRIGVFRLCIWLVVKQSAGVHALECLDSSLGSTADSRFLSGCSVGGDRSWLK